MKKKILSLGIIAILVVMLVILTGCGANNNEENENNSKVQASKKNEGKLSEIITAENYGDKINYSANGIEDWKIFYNDGENVFIITSTLIPNSKVPDSIGLEERKNQYLKNYNVIWDWDSPEFTKYAGTSSIDKNLAKKYQLEWIERHPEEIENLNMNVIASLFDEKNWSSFNNSSYAESVIGSPTLEMFVKSWNEKYPNNKLYYSDGEYGYYIGKEENPTTNGVYGLEELEQDKLYNIVPEKFSDDGMGFTLSSPGAKGEDRVCSIGKSSVSFRDPFSSYDGVRPLVCLKSDVNAKYEDGIWILEGSNNTQQNQNTDNQSNETNTTTETNITNESKETADGLKVGNVTVKYGTYNGDAAVMGETLVINQDGIATLNGVTYTYTVGQHNFAQDSSGDAIEDAIIFVEGTKSLKAFYVNNDGTLISEGPGMDYIYSGQ